MGFGGRGLWFNRQSAPFNPWLKERCLSIIELQGVVGRESPLTKGKKTQKKQQERTKQDPGGIVSFDGLV